jgi:excisionase family DNA binding protein
MSTKISPVPQESQKKRAYKVEEVAEMFGVSTDTIYRAMRAGYLRPLKGLGNRLIPLHEIDRFEKDIEARLTRKRTKRK